MRLPGYSINLVIVVLLYQAAFNIMCIKALCGMNETMKSNSQLL